MKFCFFGYMSCAIQGQTIGGGEFQSYLLAKALALDGHEVVVIDPYVEEGFTTDEGIKLIKVPNWNKGIKGLRLFTNRIPALYKLFKEQNADFYYVRMRSYIHLLSYLAAKKRKAKFIQAIASDIDILSFSDKYEYEYKSGFKISKYLAENFPSDLIFNYLLKNADYITLQHSGQYPKSKTDKSKKIIFPNIIDLAKLPEYKNERGNYYLYAGSLTMLKGADNLYKLIRKLDPRVPIKIVGMPKGDEVTKLYNELGKLKNITLIGQKNQAETYALIANAKAVINTSYFEGFPNIFLEAWGNGVPVISLNVNPGNIFNQYNLGIFCNGDVDKMKISIETDAVDSISRNCLIEFVKKYHDFNSAGQRFLKLITS